MRVIRRVGVGARVVVALLLAVAFALPAPPPARAAVLNVPSASFPTIASALAAAANGDTIQIAPGTYSETSLTVNRNITIQGTGVGPEATLVGAAGGTVFTIINGATVVIRNLAIVNGTGKADGTFRVAGGVDNRGTLTLDSVVVRNNQAIALDGDPAGSGNGRPAFGGGVYSLGPLTIVNSIIRNNLAQGGNGVLTTAGTSVGNGGSANGGGVYQGGGANGTLTVISSTIQANTARGGNGAHATSATTAIPGGDGGVVRGAGVQSEGGSIEIRASSLLSNVGNGGNGGRGRNGAPDGGSGSAGGKGEGAQGAAAFLNATAGGFISITASLIQGNRGVGGEGGRGGDGALSFVGPGGAGGAGGAGGGVFGGGIQIFGTASGAALIATSVFSYNLAIGGPGGRGGDGGVSTVSAGGDGGAGGAGGFTQMGAFAKTTIPLVITATAIVSNAAQSGRGGNGGNGAQGPVNGFGGAGGNGAAAQGGGAFTSAATYVNTTIGANLAQGGRGGDGGLNGVNLQDGAAGVGGDAVGGGLIINDATNPTTITSVTVVRNRAEGGVSGTGGGVSTPGSASGGGFVRSAGTIAMGATVVAQNTVGGGFATAPDYSGAVASQGRNFIGDGTGASGFIGTDQVGNTATPLNPQLAPLGPGGGLFDTRGYLPLPASPLIGAAGTFACPPTDQRGFARRVNACDIGAFAVQPDTLTITGGNNQSAVITQQFAQPLAVRASYGGVNLPGVVIGYVSPVGSAGATFSAAQATTNGAGDAQVTATANGIAGGPYTVVASVVNGQPSPASANFSLTNLRASVTLNVSAPATARVGAPTTITVTVTTGVPGTRTAPITVSAPNGASCVIPVGSTTCVLVIRAVGPQTITASYPGDATFLPGSGTATLTGEVGQILLPIGARSRPLIQ